MNLKSVLIIIVWVLQYILKYNDDDNFECHDAWTKQRYNENSKNYGVGGGNVLAKCREENEQDSEL